VIASQSLLWGAKQPAEWTRWGRGKGTIVASFATSANGDNVMPVVLSDHGREQA